MQNKHSINWFEIPVRDMAKAVRFYSEVIGRPLHEMAGVNGVPHGIFPSEGADAVSGALILDPKRAPGATGVTIYLGVAAVTPAVERASKAGGKVVQPLTDLGEHGTYALVADLDGNVIGLHTPKA